MPPRLSKRQQREQEEIAALASTAAPVELSSGVVHEQSESDDEAQPIPKRAAKPTAFSLVCVYLQSCALYIVAIWYGLSSHGGGKAMLMLMNTIWKSKSKKDILQQEMPCS